MSCPVNLQALPSGVFEAVLTPDNVRVRSSMNSHTSLSFPKSRSALWDGSPAGEKLRLQLCSPRKPRLVLLKKALRLAQRHAHHSNKPRLHCFFLGSLSVDADEEGVTVTLDRFDPGRDQAGTSVRVPSALLPGDVLVPCLFSTQMSPDCVVQSEAEIHHCFKSLQQCVSGRQTLDLSQLMKVRGRVVCSQQSDAAAFSLSWSSVCPSVSVEVQPVRAVPVIPTALVRSLTSANRPPSHSRQRGFLTMDQTRKLLLVLESDPKASKLPLVGLWLSGVTHVHNPQVWACCLRFLFSSALQDRVFSESRCFLLALFGSTHRAPQFFQCRGAGPGAQLDYQLLTASQHATLYQQQVGSEEGQTLRCELGSDGPGRQAEVFRRAQSSFNSSAPPAAGLSVTDQDSGVEDEDLSPRPSPSPHLPAQQARGVQPSVPELSLLMDGSFTSSHRPAPPPPAAPPPAAAAGGGRKSAPPHLHSTPNSNLQPCSCCSSHSYDCTPIFTSPVLLPAPPPACGLHPAAAPPPPPSSLHPTPPAATPRHHTPPPSSNHPISPSSTRGAPLSSHLHTPPPFSIHPPAPPPSHSPSSPLLSPPSTRLSAPPPLCSSLPPPPPPPHCPCSHPPALQHCCGDSPSTHPSDPLPPPRLPRPSCVNQCCGHEGGVVPTDTYQLFLHQDRQLRLLQAQVQMLLEAQGKLQSSGQQVETQKSTASIAVGTGASLFWGDPVEPLPPQEVQAPPLSSPSPSSSCRPPSHSDLSIIRHVGEAEDGDVTGQEAASPSAQHSALQSPVLGESASMCRPAEDQQNFYHTLMNQLSSRLQESDSIQEVEEEQEVSRRRSLSVVPDRSLSPLSSSSAASRRKEESCKDPVVSATLRQLQRLGVDLDEDLTDSERRVRQTVESSSTLARINPAAVVSRLSVPDPTVSALFQGGSVDLSLEANAIALRYLNDSQLSRLSLGGHAPRPGPTSSGDSLLSPSNMSLATRKYMRKYGLIEEEEDEEEEEEVKMGVAMARPPLTDGQNVKLLPQSQLIRDLRPKMKLLADGVKAKAADKENCSSRRPSLVRASGRQPEGSVGNILDLSHLRQLPKLF